MLNLSPNPFTRKVQWLAWPEKDNRGVLHTVQLRSETTPVRIRLDTSGINPHESHAVSTSNIDDSRSHLRA